MQTNNVRMDTMKICAFKTMIASAASPDILIIDHGVNAVLAPTTARGRAWLRQNVPEEHRKFIGSVMVDIQDMLTIHAHAAADGIDVKLG